MSAVNNAENNFVNNANSAETFGFDTSHIWKHPTQVAGVKWKNMVGTASGTFQLAACRRFYDVSQLGAICTKVFPLFLGKEILLRALQNLLLEW